MNTKRNITRIAKVLTVTIILLMITVGAALADAPANDNFANATVITGFPFTDSSSTYEATPEAYDPLGCSGQLYKTVWYTYTPTENASLHISASADDGYAMILNIVDINREPVGFCGEGQQFDFYNQDVIAGISYYFEVMVHYVGPDPSPDPDGGNFTLNITQNMPPENDDFANAATITDLPFQGWVNTAAATVEPGEPNACGTNFGKTVWFKFTPVTSGSYTAQSNGWTNSTLAVYTGDNLAVLQTMACISAMPPEFNAPKLTLMLEGGTTYYFQAFYNYDFLDGWLGLRLDVTPPPPEAYFSYSPGIQGINENVQFNNDSVDPAGIGFQSCVWDFGDGSTATDWYPIHAFAVEGDYLVQLSVTTYDGRSASTSQMIQVQNLSPTNDNFANATFIAGVPYSNTVDTTHATTELGEPIACGSNFHKTVWYAFAPATSGWYAAESSGVDWPILAVYQGDDISGLQSLGCDSTNNLTARKTVWLEAGTTYYFQTFATYEDWGMNIYFNLNSIAAPEVSFTYWPENPVAYDSIQFNNNSVDPAGSFFMTCTWDFGDGTSSADWYPVHTYSAAGDYTVQLMMTTYDGRSASTTQTITVQDLSPANDNFADATIITELPFTDTVDATYATIEPNEPQGCGWNFDHTAWYAFTPTTRGSYTVAASSWYVTLAIYTGSDLSNLQTIDCKYGWDPHTTLTLFGGVTYFFQIYNIYDEVPITLNVTQNIPPSNDDFENATIITSLPYIDSANSANATTELDEPWLCDGTLTKTIWYSFTPSISGSYTADPTGGYYYSPALAIYQGSDFSNLQLLGCGQWNTAMTTLSLTAGTTYYFQTFAEYYGDGQPINFNLYFTPPPEAYFYYWPEDPNKLENIQFNNTSSDPYGVGFGTCSWNFGDSSTASDCYPTHQFTADGDYTVQLTVTTIDGRSASTSNVVQVRTHDVGITRFVVPTSARVGQTKQINVSVKNLYYTETVQVDLYKSTANGYVWVGSLTQSMPVRPANRAQVFPFAYTFTSEDAAQGKVTFRAVVTILSARDAYTPDNEMISLATKVTQ